MRNEKWNLLGTKMKCISITGVDNSGKSTLIQRLWDETDGKYYIQDRDLSTRHFFNILLGRVGYGDNVYLKQYKEKISAYRQLLDLAVILEVNEDDWSKRCLEHKEPKLVGILPFKEHQKELIRHFDKARYKNVLRLNTSELSEDECFDKIMKRLGLNRRK